MNNRTMGNEHTPLDKLALADPDMAAGVRQQLEAAGCDTRSESVRKMVEDVIYGLSLTPYLGQSLADGYLALIRHDLSRERIQLYGDVIRGDAGDNPTYAGILAASLVPVLLYGDDDLLHLYFEAGGLMKEKWLYALAAEPLTILSSLVGPDYPDRQEAGRAWLRLLRDIFTHDLTYNQFRRFAGRFPRAVLAFPEQRRAGRIEQLRRVARRDFNLAGVFLESLGRDLALLSEEALRRFVDQGLARYAQDAGRGRKFLGLETRLALEICHGLQTSAVFSQVRRRLTHYLEARCGRHIPIKPLSALPASIREPAAMVTARCDGRTLYLPDEISRARTAAENRLLYKTLAWVETATLEFGTYYFDLERTRHMILAAGGNIPQPSADGVATAADLAHFCRLFPRPDLALDLFTLFEYGRLRTLLATRYPAGVDRFYPRLRAEADSLYGRPGEVPLLEALYVVIALGGEVARWRPEPVKAAAVYDGMIELFATTAAGQSRPEAAALTVWQAWHRYGPDHLAGPATGSFLRTPFDLRVRPDLFAGVFSQRLQQADAVREKMQQAGAEAYRSDIVKRLIEQGGMLQTDDVQSLVAAGQEDGAETETVFPQSLLSVMDIDAITRHLAPDNRAEEEHAGRVFRYREWDQAAGDYLDGHVLVRERAVPPGQPGFYHQVLDRYRGLVKKIRYAFELLKPEGMTRLRKWREGEEFDYRELLNFVIDKKAGRTPSERIYMKHLKRQRDVAVQLLLDFSRSTSNNVAGSETTTVLDIEKEAAVLFCEALTVVGDPYAIGGFSGTGRLGVDYYRLKDFEEQMTDEIAGRIEAARPRRNTRMGAAVRHAVAGFDATDARSRLLILISDGFPNDIDYKREYALEDTRRALLEARAKNISVHSITVNIAGDSALDELYGRMGHSVISDVRELPGKLLRIYGRLTG